MCAVKPRTDLKSDIGVKRDEKARLKISSFMEASENRNPRKTGIQPTTYQLWSKINENFEGSQSLLKTTHSAAFMAFSMKPK